jgi:hypothetical protein
MLDEAPVNTARFLDTAPLQVVSGNDREEQLDAGSFRCVR